MRVLGVVLALTATAAVLLALPVGDHHGITPIHCTRIDTALMAVGYFVLFFAAIGVGVERAIAIVERPRGTRDDRIPMARVVR